MAKKQIVSAYYFWYYHCVEDVVYPVEEALATHNWKQFKKLQKDLKNKYKCEFLPNDCMVKYSDGSEEYGVKLTEAIFKKITGSEYECG